MNRKELGKVLSSDKDIQERVKGSVRADGGWYDYDDSEGHGIYDIILFEYRTKPRIKYYRVYRCEGELFVAESKHPFGPKIGDKDLVHDFQIEDES